MDYDVDFDHHTSGGVTTVYIDMRRWHRLGARWRRWVTVERSPIGGKGVFAATSFEKNDAIGFYTGRVLGLAPRRKRLRRADELVAEREIDRLERRGHTMLMTIEGVVVDGSRPPQAPAEQERACGRVMFPPHAWPGMHAHYLNSCYDPATGRCARRRVNCYVASDGQVIASRAVRAGQELIIDYGADYYAEMVQRGTPAAPIEL